MACIHESRGWDTAKITLFSLLILYSVVTVGCNPAKCPENGQPFECTCELLDQTIHIMCINTNLSVIPNNLTDPLSMTFYKNSFEVLPAVNYPNLKYLDLEGNSIRYIKENSFLNLNHLETLILSNNLISGLHKNTFTGLERLMELVLSGNPLQAIPRETFLGSDLPKLTTLVMNGCELHNIEDNSFDTLDNLQVLNVSHNYLIFLPAFGAELSSLTRLEFGNNRLQKIADNQFKNLHSLMHLTLSNNKLIYISGNAFTGIGNELKSLYLRNNRIGIIDDRAFANLSVLTELDIAFNMLVQLPADSHRMPWLTLHKIIVHDNPWGCICNNSWLLMPKVQLYNSMDNVTMRCGYPSEWVGQDIYSIPEEVLTPCDIKLSAGLSAGASIAIAITVLAVVVVTILLVRHYFMRKRALLQKSLTVENANYRRMDAEEEAKLDMDNFSI